MASPNVLGAPRARRGIWQPPVAGQTLPVCETRRVATGEYLEAVVEWVAGGEAPWVAEWLRDRGLEVLPMRQGLLVTGDWEVFASVFGVDMADLTGPAELPVPEPLAGAVAAISLPGPKQILGLDPPP
jgi:hypothetical protein